MLASAAALHIQKLQQATPLDGRQLATSAQSAIKLTLTVDAGQQHPAEVLPVPGEAGRYVRHRSFHAPS
jgi:hypothetical protein